MIEIVKVLPLKYDFLAGTPKWLKLLVLMFFFTLAILILSITYENKNEFFSHWYSWGVGFVGIIFLLAGFKKENRHATVNIALCEGDIYLLLPYQYKNRYLKVNKQLLSRVHFSMYADKYRAITFTLNNLELFNVDKDKEIRSLLVDEGEGRFSVTNQIGVTSKSYIVNTLKKHLINVSRGYQ